MGETEEKTKTFQDVACDLEAVDGALQIMKEYAFKCGETFPEASDEFMHIFGALTLAIEKLDTIQDDLECING